MSSFCPLFSSGNCEKQNFGYNVPHHAVTAACSCRLSAIFAIFPDIPGIALIIRTPTAATNRTNDSFLLNFLFLLFLFIIVPLSCYILSVTISAFVIFLYIFLFYIEFPGSTLIFGLCQYFPDLYFHFQTSISDLHNRKSQDFIFFIFFIEKLSECHSRNISS